MKLRPTPRGAAPIVIQALDELRALASGKIGDIGLCLSLEDPDWEAVKRWMRPLVEWEGVGRTLISLDDGTVVEVVRYPPSTAAEAFVFGRLTKQELSQLVYARKSLASKHYVPFDAAREANEAAAERGVVRDLDIPLADHRWLGVRDDLKANGHLTRACGDLGMSMSQVVELLAAGLTDADAKAMTRAVAAGVPLEYIVAARAGE